VRWPDDALFEGGLDAILTIATAGSNRYNIAPQSGT
jgi:hypothetical protein